MSQKRHSLETHIGKRTKSKENSKKTVECWREEFQNFLRHVSEKCSALWNKIIGVQKIPASRPHTIFVPI